MKDKLGFIFLKDEALLLNLDHVSYIQAFNNHHDSACTYDITKVHAHVYTIGGSFVVGAEDFEKILLKIQSKSGF